MIFSLTILKVTNVNFSGRSMINLRLIANSMIEIYGKLEPKILWLTENSRFSCSLFKKILSFID